MLKTHFTDRTKGDCNTKYHYIDLKLEKQKQLITTLQIKSTNLIFKHTRRHTRGYIKQTNCLLCHAMCMSGRLAKLSVCIINK